MAGISPTIVLSGTLIETTAPAATIEFSPIVTPGKMIAPAPIQAFFLMRIWPTIRGCLFPDDAGCPSDNTLTLGAIRVIFNGNSAQIQKSAIEVDKYVISDFGILAVIDVQGSKYVNALVNFTARNLT